jgi:hypothetical protein
MYRRGLLTYSEGMAESLKDYAMKGVALLVLLLAAFVLFKVVLGVVSAIVWTLVGIAALIAVIWALSRIL